MDSWLDDEEINTLVKQLNPHLEKGSTYDSNWDLLREEQRKKLRYDLTRAVKIKSPTLLEFESHYSFVYRRYDGAHWHTEVRDIDLEFRKQGFTTEQKRLKENIDTIFAIKQFDTRPKWITPIDKAKDQYDPRYQLVKINSVWLCCIDNKLYESSNRRPKLDRGYTELSFSTKNHPLFTIEQTEKILDRIL